MQSKLEVQYKDWFGCWRRWALVPTLDRAVRSHAALVLQLGTSAGTRVVEVRKP